jgi:hypothetical protein
VRLGGAVETGNGVTNETADSLGPALLVGACGVFVALLRKRAEIVFADVDRQPPKPAARTFSVGSHSLGWCRHVRFPSVEGMVHANRSLRLKRPKSLNGPRAVRRWAAIAGGVAKAACKVWKHRTGAPGPLLPAGPWRGHRREADGSTEPAARFVACRSGISRRRQPLPTGLPWKMAAGQTTTARAYQERGR